METAFNYYMQGSRIDDQKIDCSFISMGAMFYTIQYLPLKGIHVPYPPLLLADHTKIQKFLDLSIQKTRFKLTRYFHKNNSLIICDAACDFTKINTLRQVFFTFFKLHKRYQIAQRTTMSFPLLQLCSRKYYYGFNFFPVSKIESQSQGRQ